MSGLTLAVNDGFRTWEAENQQAYHSMTRNLTAAEGTNTRHITQTSTDENSAMDRFTEEARKRGESSQVSLELIQKAMQRQSLLLEKVQDSVDAGPSNLEALCSDLRAGIASIKELSRHNRQGVAYSESPAAHGIDCTESSIQEDQHPARDETGRQRRTDTQPNRVTTLLGLLVAEILESCIIALWVVLWALLQRTVLILQRAGRSMVLYRAPILQYADCIQFFDAVNKYPRILQYELCRDWDLFNHILRQQLVDLPGFDKVRNGEYFLLDLRSGKALPEESWASSIVPGSKVAMSMWMKEWRSAPGSCPRPSCQAVLTLARKRQTSFSQCSKCSLVFHTSDRGPAAPNQKAYEARPNFDAEFDFDLRMGSNPNNINARQDQTVKDVFRRIHVAPMHRQRQFDTTGRVAQLERSFRGAVSPWKYVYLERDKQIRRQERRTQEIESAKEAPAPEEEGEPHQRQGNDSRSQRPAEGSLNEVSLPEANGSQDTQSKPPMRAQSSAQHGQVHRQDAYPKEARAAKS
ncbi:hypothetical protein BU16DRAFT_371386 [Lophium mytilinum]|uniref:Ubiquitin-like domain-containing protein n=1 Tax=Lophium mytilinum TaxID=390894 RepID=A0A6A6QVN6_9PEZI|nr:hypothetical protein BU16DRAFT_371386 [Lophium mytilinum]